MEKKFINFDTNYINKILDNELEANKILKELKQEYNFSINIATFVEIVQQKINNKEKFYKLIDFLINNKIYITEFKNNRCIEDKSFSFQKFKIDSKKDRKDYFFPIKDNYYNFLCRFISLFVEWILYALMELLSENLNGNIEYKTYLNKKSCQFQMEFRNLYEQRKIKIKDRFNKIVYMELKKMKNFNIRMNNTLLEQIIKSFYGNESDMMYVFHADSKITKETRNKFVDIFFIKEMKPFLDKKFDNNIFEKYIKIIFEKLIISGGKMDPNDISDALILSGIDNNAPILITNDKKILNFLKDNGMYFKEIYDKFSNI